MSSPISHKQHTYNESDGHWIIDTDPGIDDAFALTFSMNFLQAKLSLISIEAGNVGSESCYANAKKLCIINEKLYKISRPGSNLTLSNKSLRTIPSIHGHDGFFDFTEYLPYIERYDKEVESITDYSPIEIVKTINKHYSKNEKVNLLTLAPLTNISIAYMLDPTIVNKLSKVIIMGGAYNDLGNISPSGEFNFACDDVSAKIVLDNFKNITVYCWEPSVRHLVFPKDIACDCYDNDRKSFIKKVVQKKMEWNQGGVYADYGAAVSAFYPKSIVKYRDLYADVVIDSETKKQSRFLVSKKNVFENKQKRKVSVVYDLDMKTFHELINEALN